MTQYPHLVRKAIPVTSLMVNNAIDRVDAVQLPRLALVDGDWLPDVRLDHLRDVTWLLVLAMMARRAGEGCIARWVSKQLAAWVCVYIGPDLGGQLCCRCQRQRLALAVALL